MAMALGARPAAESEATPDSGADGARAGADAARAGADAARAAASPTWPASRSARVATATAGGVALLAAVVVLGFPYLAVREMSVATDLRQTNPAQALRSLSTAADLNPLSADPGRIAGTIALGTGRLATATQRFEQAIARDPGGWYPWLGAGLAASARGARALARHDFEVAASINPKQIVAQEALSAVDSAHPLLPATALAQLARSLS
jgi:Flp pilus assembly protein TadD